MVEQSDKFPATRWTLVGRAATDPDAQGALSELLTRYGPALKAHLLYSRGVNQETADDLLHDFIHDKIILGNLIAQANQARGKFRTLLLTAIERYAIDVYRKKNTAGRSPGLGALVSLDVLPAMIDVAAKPLRPTAVYDVAWIQTIIERAVREVEIACRESNRTAHWTIFEARILNPTLHGIAPEPYDTLAERLHFSSPVNAWNAMVTVKRMLEKTLRAIIGEYTGDDEAVEAELREIFAILAEIDV